MNFIADHVQSEIFAGEKDFQTKVFDPLNKIKPSGLYIYIKTQTSIEIKCKKCDDFLLRFSIVRKLKHQSYIKHIKAGSNHKHLIAMHPPSYN